ncbi:MAG: NAD(P)/FAD-dependent oxidoreductase [Alphaproteobacteria bacterium]|nr:NAD(P)/FAD-dependent oxidoreductase [Alphaproteobacteria bacterium]MCW5740344.1 NAD(P)/FAD-dependent oxidoreductase [Alphaproteobacteria bacterium]
MRQRLVVVGNGMAAHRLLERLHARAPDRWSITVLGAEPRANYNRILLSAVLAGDKSAEAIMESDAAWFAERGVALSAGCRITRINRARRVVIDECGGETPYDRLVLATGSDPVLLPLPGANLPEVMTFRDLDDVDRLIAATRTARSAVVIGGGLLGLEAASGLQRRGLEVTVVHLMGHLMERQLDADAGAYLRHDLERRGIAFALSASTAAIEGDGHVSGVRLQDGRVLPADLVVMAVGIRPNTALALEAGLAVGRGVIVDDTLVTSDPHIFALGECAEHRGLTYGLVAPAWEQAAVLAAHLAGEPARYPGSIVGTNLKVAGVSVFSAGIIEAAADDEDLLCVDPSGALYRRVILRDGRVVGAILVGDARDGGWLFDLMREGRPVGALREAVALGRDLARAAA